MALEFFTGFDHYATADLALGVTPRWNSIGSNLTVQSSIVRNGTSALRANGTGSYVIKSGLSNAVTRVVGFGMYVTSVSAFGSNHPFFAMGDTTLVYDGTSSEAHISLSLASSGAIQAYRGRDIAAGGIGTALGSASSNVLSSATWAFIEIVGTVNNSTGVIEVWVNGSQWLNLTAQDTQAGGGAYCNTFGICGGNSLTYFDDVYTVSGSGGTLTGRLGDVKCIYVAPSTGDGAVANFTPSTGTDNGAMVDDAAPDSAGNYNASTVAGDIDTYAFPASNPGGAVLGLNIHNWVQKTDAGACDAQSVARISSTNYLGTQTGVSQTAGYLTELSEVSPATSVAWTAAEIDGAEFGIKRAV